MAFLSSLDIAGSGITAQKRRLDVITENITNRETTRTEDGGPYRRKLSVFKEIQGHDRGHSRLRSARLRSEGIRQSNTSFFGVRDFEEARDSEFARTLRSERQMHARENKGVMVSEIIEDQSEFIPVYDPTHPDANDEGYVMMPNVNTSVEMMDAMAATRSYSANIAAFEAIKAMATQALQMGR